jgi:hypothetical protein
MAVDDLLERSTVGMRDRSKRTIRGVAERDQPCAIAILWKAQDAARKVLVGDRGMARAYSQICCHQHHCHDHLAEVELNRFARVRIVAARGDERNCCGRPRDVSGAAPHAGQFPQLRSVGARDEIPTLEIAGRGSPAARLENAVEVPGCERTVGEVADVTSSSDCVPRLHARSLPS